ncbi:hypothetical protein A2765_04180 [Candidatus Kaiserbacteria bacterium RIFCSPHIGHO2_01_FULL_56_24]|uniref:Uncharacterized protein n=1 Tax=Candidatus Kaiserbacteria bacterium RIFCSPHIGHO2_01_FULL_56_24 TaxID=1798487 RepID=A0A1F6DEA7_9BACT|nr:MAG: hypothetical protein A2765_04180 [Candidatus Kaiserbacteria bacterium RIFCSPHIGHO2_01_FULL_56_24]
MDAELAERLKGQDAKLEEILLAVHKMQRYFQITFWVTVVFFVLPLVLLLFAVPKAMNSYLGSLNIDTIDTLQAY